MLGKACTTFIIVNLFKQGNKFYIIVSVLWQPLFKRIPYTNSRYLTDNFCIKIIYVTYAFIKMIAVSRILSLSY